jgi:hypothetical protein
MDLNKQSAIQDVQSRTKQTKKVVSAYDNPFTQKTDKSVDAGAIFDQIGKTDHP